jgi:protein-S-isoprenylcysteine O-methyltransferase Ste14
VSAPQKDIEIKAPAGIIPGVPLSQLKEAVAQQQGQQKAPVAVGAAAQPNRALELGLVAVQLVALFVVVFGFVPPILWQNTFLQVVGMLFVGVAIFVAIWAVLTFKQKINILPSPSPSGFLVTGGPFGYIRHPLYFALLAGGTGLMLAYPTIPRLLALLVLAFVLYVKMNYEEARLAERYNGYEKYKAHTGKLLPKFSRQKQVQLAQPPNAEKPNDEQ